MALNGELGIEFILLYTFIRHGPVLSKNDHQVMGVAMAVTCLYRIFRTHGTVTAYIEITVNKLNRKPVKAKLLHLYLQSKHFASVLCSSPPILVASYSVTVPESAAATTPPERAAPPAEMRHFALWTSHHMMDATLTTYDNHLEGR